MRAFWLLVCLIFPMQALALSCMKPSVTRTFKEIHAAPEIYIVVEGRLTLDAHKLPETNVENPSAPPLTRVPATLSGTSMTGAGFDAPFSQAITLEVACFGPWCGGAQNGMEVLAFLRKTATGYALAIDPCGGHVFPNQKKLRRQVLRCFKGGACRE